MFVRVTSGYLFAGLTSTSPGLRLELNFSIDYIVAGQILHSQFQPSVSEELATTQVAKSLG